MGSPYTMIANFHYYVFQRDLELLYMPVFTDKDAITEEMNECFRLAGLEEISYEQLSRTWLCEIRYYLGICVIDITSNV